MSKTYLASFANQCITEKATMEKPMKLSNIDFEFLWDDDKFKYNQEWQRYEHHLASLATYPFPVSKEMDGKEFVEGIDFKLEFEKYTNPDTGRRSRRIIALPLQPGNGGEYDINDKSYLLSICEWIKTQPQFKQCPITDSRSIFYHVSVLRYAELIYEYSKAHIPSPSSPDVAEMAKVLYEKCNHCKGEGWTAEHDPHCDGSPNYCGSRCPIQVQCEHCRGAGYTLSLSSRQVGEAVDNGKMWDEVGEYLKESSFLFPAIEELKSKFNLTRK